MLFNPSRDEARNFLFESWRKRKAGELLTPLEDLVAQLIDKHPEFHAVLENPDRHQDQDYLPEHGATNPFLHLMMHLSISEQLAIDQPAGILGNYQALTMKLGDEHRAMHGAMDCLAEMIWTSQRYGTPPDGAAYVTCLEKKAQ